MATEKPIKNGGKVMSQKNAKKFDEILNSMKAFFNELTGAAPGNPDAEKPAEMTETAGDKEVEKAREQPSLNCDGMTKQKNAESPMAEDEKPEDEEEVSDEEDEKMKEELNKLAQENAELKNKIATLESEKQDLVALQNKVETLQKEKSDMAWAGIKNKIPKGMTHTPEIEAATRKEFESDPVAFTNKVLDQRMAGAQPAEGGTQSAQQAIVNTVRGIGVKNPYTGKWDDVPAGKQ